MNDSPSVFQSVLFGGLALLALLPLLSLVCRSTALRECAAEWGCSRCVSCCSRLFGNDGSANDSDDLETGARGPEPRTIAAYYQMLYAHRGVMHQPSLALGLTTWREDVRHYVPVRDVFDMKLQQIQIRDESMQRYEAPVIPLNKTDVELTHPCQQGQGTRDTVLCGDDEEETKDEA